MSNIINLFSNRSHGIGIYTDINDVNYKYQLKILKFQIILYEWFLFCT